MLRATPSAVLLLALVGASAAQDKIDLKVYASAEGKFKVQMPGEVKTTKKDVEAGGKKMVMNFASATSGKDRAVVMTYLDLPDPIGEGARKSTVEKTATAAAQKGKVISSKERDHGPDKLPGRDCLFENDKHFVRYRSVLSGQRLYQLMILGPKEFVTSKVADGILDSLEVSK